MPPDSYLCAGLDALARSHPTATAESGFGNGHRAAALLSTYFLFQDGLVEPQAEAPIRALADHWTRLPLFAPRDPEPPAPEDLGRLVLALGRACGTDQAHGVIFPSLALRAFRQRPDLITRTRIDGLMHMAEAYIPAKAFAQPQSGQRFDPGAFADEVLAGFVGSAKAYGGRFQGYSFHVLTFGQAILDLRAAGCTDLAIRAEPGFRRYLADCQLGPQGPNHHMAFPVTDPSPQMIRPEQAGFWLSLSSGPEFAEGLGHILKYAYAFTALGRLATDAEGLARARELYYLSAWG